MARYVIDAPTLVRIVDDELRVDPGHQLVAPNSIRSEALQVLLREVGALALFVQRDRFATLFDHRLQHPLDIGLGNALVIGLSACRDVALLEPGQDQADGRKGTRIPGLKRLFEAVGEGLTQHRHAPLRSSG